MQYPSKDFVEVNNITIKRRYIPFLNMPPKERKSIMLAILQHLLKCILISCGIIGLIFMFGCTLLVILSIIRGDIRINFIRENTKTNSKKEK